MKNYIRPLAPLLLLLALPSAPAVGAPLPPPDEIFAGKIAPLRADFEALLSAGPENPEAMLGKLDALLAKLPEPGRARGVVMLAKASLLSEGNKAPEAIHAIEESIRLLPGFSAPLYVASEIYMYSGNPGRGADLLLQASRIDPQIMRKMDDYALNGLLGRLTEAGDKERLATISERLLEIAWTPGSLAASDRVVFAALDSRLAVGDVHGARTLVPRLIAPGKVVTLLTDKRYDAVRDTALAHAGPRLANLWPGFLARAEADWRSQAEGLGPGAYARALAQAGADSKLIATFQPLFGKALDRDRDQGLVFVASPLATALGSQERWDEALQVYSTALRVWPDKDKAQALNLTGNRGRLLVMKGDFAAGLAQLDVVIAQAERLGGEVNDEAASAFHYYRACALHQLGRGREAATSEAVVTRRRMLSPGQYTGLQICRDDLAAAKSFLIEALHSEESRGDALSLVQPSGDPVPTGAWGRHMRKTWDSLRRDPEIRATALRYGYILPEPANASVRESASDEKGQ